MCCGSCWRGRLGFSGMRDIQAILRFRGDISPFLVHLTRNVGVTRAEATLKKIIAEKQLIASENEISDARFAVYTADMSPEERKKYFGAICFTETPLNEVHCLLEIKGRSVNLEPFGLVFLKERCAKRGVDPVIYINNNNGDKVKAMKALLLLIQTRPDEAANILPLLAIFGDRLTPPRRA